MHRGGRGYITILKIKVPTYISTPYFKIDDLPNDIFILWMQQSIHEAKSVKKQAYQVSLRDMP